MIIKGQVMNAHEETRDLVAKDGTRRSANIKHILMLVPADDGKGQCVCNIRSYDSNFALPVIGKEWITPSVRKYECYNGNVAEVMI